jgi:predicted DNA-binding transcriptional regulator YafY
MPRPTVRVLALLELLQAGGTRPVPALAERLAVDERTVRRYAQHLIELGMPVESVRGRYGGYRIGAGSRLPPLMLTDDEALSVVVGLAAAERGGLLAASGTAAQTASAKIRRVLPPRLARPLAALIHSTSSTPAPLGPAGAATAAVLLTVAEAAHDHRPVQLTYTDHAGADSVRTLLPWGVVAHHGRWYVTGPDSRSGKHRTFRLDRISHVLLGTGRFEVPPGFDPAAQVLSGLLDAPRAHEVSVLVRTTPARIATQLPPGIAAVDTVAPTDPTCPDAEQGWSRVRLHAERLDWVAAALAALDAPLVIEGPELLRDELLALATRLSAQARRRPPELTA